ncbi:ly6/PLAUR domain-containing protein 6 isoform X2 [Xyrauchen texanus]|uniref:ly6/PLAUR domain-containing protein 6 isoform X2 n=1 Tax=Xyrauchen texanus TaxID=154827 RepID=UPI002241D998|nr:ly6/PLAUR domain-containing protein 6 isoform X2 [Xyrauchen texanus]
MKPWPIMAWGLMLTAITGWIKNAQSRDFTEKDIIFLHPSTTPYPGGFKCFTCEDAPDNYECNRWAPDLYCPRESRYCYTHHKMIWDGTTVSVTKRCVALEDCLATGCTEIDHEGNKWNWHPCTTHHAPHQEREPHIIATRRRLPHVTLLSLATGPIWSLESLSTPWIRTHDSRGGTRRQYSLSYPRPHLK